MFRALPLCWIVVFAVGCGHPATREECEAIFQKSAELELLAHDISDPRLVESRLEQVRLARGDALIDDCVGRKVTDSALACVKQASSSEELDKCLE